MRKKYKIYSVILTGIILTGCKSVRMTSQDRQQFMPNGISVAQQLLEETEDATQAKSPEAIKTTLSANNTTSESSVEESESSMKESNQSQDKQENNVNILALEIEPYELSDVCSAIFEKSLDEVEQSQNQYGMYYLTDGDKRVRKYDMLGLEYEVKGVSGSYSAIAEMATNTLRWQEILLRESFPQDKIDSEIKPEDAEKICREIALEHMQWICRVLEKLIKMQEIVYLVLVMKIKKMNMMVLGQVYLQVGSRGHKRTRHI